MEVLNSSVHHLTKVIDALKDICGDNFVFTDEEILYNFERDETLDFRFPFDILIKPAGTAEIAAIVKLCNQYHIPITPRGGGSGVTGGALPVRRGVVLSMERLNNIIELNKTDRYIVAEAGVITADLCEYAEKMGLYFPVAPSSSAYSFIGGNVAENAGSINSCKYGTTSQYVLNLEVVLANGDVIWTGANVSKNVTGLDITRLFVGSEGTLGIITKIVYRLIRKPAHEVSLLAAFESTVAACQAIIAIKASGLLPSAVELIGGQALALTAAYLQTSIPHINEDIHAHVLINIQEDTETALLDLMNKLESVITVYTPENLLVATTKWEKETLWKLRFSIGAAMTSGGKKYRDVDTCVPLTVLYPYIKQVEAICARAGIQVIYFGHAMDGNLHTMLLLNEGEEQHILQQVLRDIYQYAIDNGGVISGEHGIGLLQKEFIPMQFSTQHLALLKNLKQFFDPNGIINPGKIF